MLPVITAIKTPTSLPLFPEDSAVENSGDRDSESSFAKNNCETENTTVKCENIKEEPVDEEELFQETYDVVSTGDYSPQPENCTAKDISQHIYENDSKNEGQDDIENVNDSDNENEGQDNIVNINDSDSENERQDDIETINVSSDNSSQCSEIHSDYVSAIPPELLVRCLGNSSTLSATLSELQSISLQTSSVLETVKVYPRIFQFQDDSIHLRPNIKICNAYCSPKGCENRKSCLDLHICKNYIVDECRDPECIFGHSWSTGHNLNVLDTFFLDNLSPDVLHMLVKESMCDSENECISVCRLYNKEGCSKSPCLSLHICLRFLAGLMKYKSYCSEDCPLNHDFKHWSCINILAKHRISHYESKRDIAFDIQRSNPAVFYEETQSFCKNNLSLQLGENRCVHSSELSENSYSSTGTKRKRNSTGFDSEENEKSIEESTKTVWSHDLKGMVLIPEICYFSVVNTCNLESYGCQRLHSALHFHWQVCEQGGEWLNLRPNQVKCLERAYCDPSKNAVTLPRIDPASLDHSVRALFMLMGRDSWFSDFHTLTLTNSSASKVLKIRRLSSEKINGVEIISSKYVWYFLDKNNVWIQYGKPDSDGNNALASSITSEQIEEMYLKNSSASVQFTNAQFTYELNFQQMIQVNLGTLTTRQVKRRPQPHLQDEGFEDLPPYWNVMLPKQRVERVPLSGTSPEYKAVLDLLSRNPNSNFRWMSIERIQNPYLWKAFENKKKEMTALYGSLLTVDVRYLFHGTSHDKVKNICEENFDWRLHGSVNGQAFGRGTYFSTDYLYSCTYARPDANGYRYLFIASVAVGTKTVGNNLMQRPPLNNATSLPFDSTVNNLVNPTIIVKYDKQEYYPEYLVIFC